MQIGFIGLGLMGTPIVLNLRRASFEVWVWNRTREKASTDLNAGALWAESIAALAEASDVVMTMVTDAAASEAVICGPGGVLEHARSGTILIDMGSIAPEMSQVIAERAEARGVSMLDAPVAGNPKVA